MYCWTTDNFNEDYRPPKRKLTRQEYDREYRKRNRDKIKVCKQQYRLKQKQKGIEKSMESINDDKYVIDKAGLSQLAKLFATEGVCPFCLYQKETDYCANCQGWNLFRPFKLFLYEKYGIEISYASDLQFKKPFEDQSASAEEQRMNINTIE